MSIKKNAPIWILGAVVVLIIIAALYATSRPKPDLTPIQSSYSLEEVRQASTTERCYAAIETSVYDLTPYVAQDARILSLCGTDATAAATQLGGGNLFKDLRIGDLRR